MQDLCFEPPEWWLLVRWHLQNILLIPFKDFDYVFIPLPEDPEESVAITTP